MRYIRNLKEYTGSAGSVVTLGKFDGVHEGHRLLMKEVLRAGCEHHLETIVFTFDVSPQVRLGGTQTKTLMTNRERFLCLERLGLDTLIECPFTKDIQTMEAARFVEEILLKQLHAVHIVVGDDFRFGKGRAGDAAFLKEMSERTGRLFTVEVVGKKRDEITGRDISSTWIREVLCSGDIETANRLLGEPYSLTGEIVHGRQLGRTLDIPTINQIPQPDKLLPPDGVYFSRTRIGMCIRDGITNIGTKPTVDGSHITAETHLFDCSGDLYGQEAHVELLHYHRAERKFADLRQLREQMQRDISEARDFLTVKL